jgi:hypothetical protein
VAGRDEAVDRLQDTSLRWEARVPLGAAGVAEDLSRGLEHQAILVPLAVGIAAGIAHILALVQGAEPVVVSSTASVDEPLAAATGGVVCVGGEVAKAHPRGDGLQTLVEAGAVLWRHTPVSQCHHPPRTLAALNTLQGAGKKFVFVITGTWAGSSTTGVDLFTWTLHIWTCLPTLLQCAEPVAVSQTASIDKFLTLLCVLVIEVARDCCPTVRTRIT